MNWAQSPTIIKFSLASPLNMYVQLYIYIDTWSFGGFWMSLLLELRTGRWWKILVSQLWKLVNAEGILLFQLSLDWLKWGLAWQYHRWRRGSFSFCGSGDFSNSAGCLWANGSGPIYKPTQIQHYGEKQKSTKRKIHRNWTTFSHEWPSLDAKVQASTGQPIVYERLVNA